MAQHKGIALFFWLGFLVQKPDRSEGTSYRFCAAFHTCPQVSSVFTRDSTSHKYARGSLEAMAFPVDVINSAANRAGDIGKTLVDTEQNAISSSVSALESLSKIIPTVPLHPLTDKVLEVVDAFASMASAIDSFAATSNAIGPVYQILKEQVTESVIPFLEDVPAPVVLFASAVATFSLTSSLLNIGKPPSPSTPYPMGKYDAAASREYFEGRTGEVVARTVQIALSSARFGSGILADYVGKKLKSNSDIRAMELCELLTVLGPSFIKIGQSLSIRTDILSPEYQRGLKSLQDQVPAFDTVVARRMIEDELGLKVDEIFSEFSDEPVAAASLGQVYRGKLHSSGKDVAIKVQRPNIMNQIALDMYLIREIAPLIKRTFNLNTDLVDIVDVWGTGFVEELDYRQEADNAIIFMESLNITSLSQVVFAPAVIDEYTSGKVLVTEWVDGERLDKSTKEDVTILCSIAMNTYLTMMLETGVLHCDPHPGNLLRTPDGKLCILDWGMVTRLSPDLQVSLIEHMAHLTSADYAEIPKDLLVLGFIPESKAELIKDSGVVETLAEIYGAWTKGGGAATIDVNKVVSQLQDLTAEKGNLFQIPSYFAYIAKSFSVLEGIGLSNNPKYSIIKECLPYVSKRLLTDENPRTAGALNTFIFGPSKSRADRILDYDRVEQLITGFGDYSSSASGELINKGPVSRKDLIDRQADEILELLLTEEDTPLQSIFLEQLAKIISSSSRSIWSTVREASGTLPSGRTVLGTVVDPLGLWRTSPVVRVSDLDQKTIETTRNLIALLEERNQRNPLFDLSTITNEELIEISRLLVRKLWNKRYGMLKTGGKLARALLELTADKLDSGERDVTSLTKKSDAGDVNKIARDGSEMNSSMPSTKVQASGSKRLESAKKLLAELEDIEKEPIPASSARVVEVIE